MGALGDTLTRLFMAMEFFAALEIAVTRLQLSAGFRGAILTRLGAQPAGVDYLVWRSARQPAARSRDAAQHARASNYIAAPIDVARSSRTPDAAGKPGALSGECGEQCDPWPNWRRRGYGDHPDAWEFQQVDGDEIDDESGLTVRQIIQAEFWMDDETAQRDRAAWLEVADAVERKAGGR
jgi:hypothetical protein